MDMAAMVTQLQHLNHNLLKWSFNIAMVDTEDMIMDTVMDMADMLTDQLHKLKSSRFESNFFSALSANKDIKQHSNKIFS